MYRELAGPPGDLDSGPERATGKAGEVESGRPLVRVAAQITPWLLVEPKLTVSCRDVCCKNAGSQMLVS
jgi:hypothetical protein